MKFFSARKYLLLILVLAATLRFYHLADRGIFISDEGYYLNGSKTIYVALEYCWKKFLPGHVLPSFQEYLVRHGGGYPDNGKPGYFLLVTLSFLFFGVSDYAALFLSAFLGSLTILLVYFIGKKSSNERAGLWAALILAVSPYHINYSRSALSIATSTFFALCGLTFYLHWYEKLLSKRESPWYLVASGSFLGFAYTCHYNLFWFIFFCIGVHVYLCFFNFKRRNLFQRIKRVVGFISSVAFPIFLLDIPYRVARKLLADSVSFSTGRPYEIRTYLGQIKHQFIDAGGLNFTHRDISFYIKLLLTSEGIVVMILTLLGFMVILFKAMKRQIILPHLFILGMALLPFSLFSLYIFKVSRSIALAIPAISLASALAVEWLMQSMRSSLFSKKAGQFLVAFFIVLSGLDRSAEIVYARSNNKEVYQFLKAKGTSKCISSQPPNATFYLGKDSVYPLWGVTWAEAKRLYEEENYRYLLLDAGKFFSSRDTHFFIYQVMNSNYTPIFTSNFIPFYLLSLDYTYTGEKLTQDPTLQVYDLKEIFEK